MAGRVTRGRGHPWGRLVTNFRIPVPPHPRAGAGRRSGRPRGPSPRPWPGRRRYRAALLEAPLAITVYGIPTCGTVKKARAWLDRHGVAHAWVDFRATPPEPARVARWVRALGAGPLRNTSGGAYRALGDEKAGWDDARWTAAFQADPMLIKRPVVEIDGEPVLVGFAEGTYTERFGG
jgi:arsenate reductase